MPAIMVVDDEKDILRLIGLYLEKRGIRHIEFSDAAEALAHFKQNDKKYDLVLSDIRMPQMSGLELAGHIRSINPDVKILLMSAFVIDSDQMRRLQKEQEIAEFISKPFSFATFGAVLDRHLGQGKNGMSLLFF
jgi:two-component system cell cycle sensor histidine kinase/response regulator CckA